MRPLKKLSTKRGLKFTRGPTPRGGPCPKKNTESFRTESNHQHGRFTIRGIDPGSYTLYVWQDLEDGVYRDPDFLKSQEANGTAVKVEEGSHQQVELKVSPVGEEWK